MTEDDSIALSISFNKSVHSITVSPSSTLTTLISHFATTQPDDDDTTLYKIIVKGQTYTVPGPHDSTPITSMFSNGQKVLVVASSSNSILHLDQHVTLTKKKDRIRFEQQQQGPSKIRDTSSLRTQFATLSTLSTPLVGFNQLVALPDSPTSPFYNRRFDMLRQLSQDPSILDVMKQKKWNVAVLGELHPLTDPTLLGVNENRGDRIRLRLLTDRLDGLRSYKTVRRVLIHELTHNEVGPHELVDPLLTPRSHLLTGVLRSDNFKTLDSALTKQVEQFERNQRQSGRRLGGDLGNDVYEPPEEIEHACASQARHGGSGGVYVLGGQELASQGASESSDERRQRTADAASRRIQQASPPK